MEEYFKEKERDRAHKKKKTTNHHKQQPQKPPTKQTPLSPNREPTEAWIMLIQTSGLLPWIVPV